MEIGWSKGFSFTRLIFYVWACAGVCTWGCFRAEIFWEMSVCLVLLVHLGSYKKTPETGLFMNNKSLFLKVQEAKKSEIKVPADLVSDKCRLHFLVHRYPTSYCVLIWWKEGWKALWGLFYKGANPVHESSTSMAWLPPTPPPPPQYQNTGDKAST